MATQGRQVLGGRYRILDVLGDGGMARVFRAEDTRLGRVVAVKILHQHYLSQPEFVRRFEQEAQLAARLSHPNIVAIYDVDRQDGAYYIVMEYVEGGSLKGVITQDAPLAPSLVAAVARQLGQALDAAHAHGVIHRDIKPENILLTPSYDVKVGDFGIARALTSAGQTATGMVMGSVSYFSPEQAQGKPATAESDLYSAGVVLYEMLTGRLPFAAGNPLATAMQHITQEPAPPRAIVPALPLAVDRVILQALSKDPTRRYHSGALLADALDTAIVTGTSRTATRAVAAAATAHTTATHAAPVRPGPAPTARIAPALARPRRRVAALPLALLVLVGGGAAYAATHPDQLRDMFAGSPAGVTGGGNPSASGPPHTAVGGATTPVTSTPTGSSENGLLGAAASATPTAQPSLPPPTATPSATARLSPTPRSTAPTLAAGSMTVAIVTARGYSRSADGSFTAVGARNIFQPNAHVYAVFHFYHLPHGVFQALWTFPGGGHYSHFFGEATTYSWADQYVGGPGQYRVAALVNGKVVGSHRFSVVAGAAPSTGTQFVAPNNAPVGQPATADQFIAGNGRGYGKGHRPKDKGFKGGGNGHGNGNGGGDNSGSMASVG